jgi:ABC-type multidrug transport system fused ATPase/permease subunit
MAAQSMTMLAPEFTTLSNAAAAAAELFGIMNETSELDPLDPSGRQPGICEGKITVRNVDFVYPSRPSAQVLRDFSIDIPAGETTALVGASGSGKSTMIGLLERWYNPLKGSIILDGYELSEYNTKWLRSNIRLVQQVVLISKTLEIAQSNRMLRSLCFSKALYLTTLLKGLRVFNALLGLMIKWSWCGKRVNQVTHMNLFNNYPR